MAPDVLVIDDEEPMCLLLQDLLSSMGYRVRTATDGWEGIRLFEKQPFPVVMCDLGMPGADGWTVCKRVKALARQTVVVLVTGWWIDRANQGLRGVDLVLYKPFSIQEVMVLVQELKREAA